MRFSKSTALTAVYFLLLNSTPLAFASPGKGGILVEPDKKAGAVIRTPATNSLKLHHGTASGGYNDHGHIASSHAPIGVMGDHHHKKGEWMVSYRYMHMEMDGSRDGTNSLSETDIATSIPNRFFGNPMQPSTLRVVPTQMSMDMHMAGVMYGLTDNITLIGMTSYINKSMDHVTFQGGMGTTQLGNFTTQSEGFGDTSLGALVNLMDTEAHKFHVNASISLPTGSITQTGQILTPTGGTPDVRLPYAMQLGSGTYDLKPGITYLGRANKISWGAQALGTIRLGENSENYTLGDRAEATTWLAYDWSGNFSGSARVKLASQGSIDGIDALITGPVQTADPDNYGGETAELLLGINYLFTKGALAKNRLAIEAGMPLFRDLNGPQLETDWNLTLGWQRAF